jgi:AcrR family transcriptional regulator
MTAMTVHRTTREALLDAAYDVVLAGAWETARMLDVARSAGVSRQTLYNEFGSKDALAEALALREAERFIAGNERFLDASHFDRPVDAVAAVTAWTLQQASDNPLLKAALTNDAGALLPFLTTRWSATSTSTGRIYPTGTSRSPPKRSRGSPSPTWFCPATPTTPPPRSSPNASPTLSIDFSALTKGPTDEHC